DKTKDTERGEKEKETESYSVFRLDFMATVRDIDGSFRKILIEIQKSWDTLDVIRFRKYLGEQYARMDVTDGKETHLPITTIYILGNNLAETDCPCIKVGRTYTDMINRKTIDTKSKFIENLTHDSYVIQAGRITDVRYSTNLDKLLSIFEQRYFVKEGSDVIKEYPYQPDDENMTLITGLLYEMGADPRERKQIEDEEEFLRILNNAKNEATREKDKIIEQLTETNKYLTETNKYLSETVRELSETVEKQDKKIADLERLFRDWQNLQ
ncbi:MAG: hypothetical protein LBQ01_09695, partial [Prevotellaceae bacterium]|nr:hypothetical protein [Prevotellaceae bacterium]